MVIVRYFLEYLEDNYIHVEFFTGISLFVSGLRLPNTYFTEVKAHFGVYCDNKRFRRSLRILTVNVLIFVILGFVLPGVSELRFSKHFASVLVYMHTLTSNLDYPNVFA